MLPWQLHEIHLRWKTQIKSNKLCHFYVKAYWCYDNFFIAPYVTPAVFFQHKNICMLNFHIYFPLTRTQILLLKRLLMLSIGLTESESAGQGRLPILFYPAPMTWSIMSALQICSSLQACSLLLIFLLSNT